MPTVAILGASGYAGAELLRLCSLHPDLKVGYAAADTQAGLAVASLYPNLAAAHPGLSFDALDVGRAAAHDVVFCGLPHQSSMEVVPALAGRVGLVVDLSGAFRLHDAALYPRWYGFAHTHPDLLAEAVYGLPERHRAALRSASLIATPGCYVTAATLVLGPLLDRGLVEPSGIVVDAASGVSGAGRTLKAASLFCSVDEDVVAYGLLDHRHTPEIEQNLGAQVLLTPHLVPMSRGILATCYARPTRAASTDDVLGALHEAYDREPFVHVTASPPGTKATLGSNSVHVTARADHRTGWVVALAALDNLTKGAAGGALQSANLALGLPETSGLPVAGLAP